ncbi:MAG: protein kinase [Myxococcales bacterium]|nr:protein kinase [Myxococcales bacterium]
MLDSPPTIPLGPFELVVRVASGGMGEIWEGYHRAAQMPVAVKVMTGEHVRDPEYHADFRREVEAVAALNHPGIIMVFDYGVIDRDSARASAGQLVAGCPYLVMEYASRGSLDDLAPPFGWYDFKRIVIALLGALGHAHSRGLIHLDIKPGNVLLGSREEPRPRLKLTDFGIAHALDLHRPTVGNASPHGTVEQARGTPWYMSPEQLCGRWRDYGPWSDLYALGVLCWELATGNRPFDGESARAIGFKHLEAALPEFDPFIDVPIGLRGWLTTLMGKKPPERFQRASDAMAAFIAMGDPDEITTHVGPAPEPVDPSASQLTARILDISRPPDERGQTVITSLERIKGRDERTPPAAIRDGWPVCPAEEPPPPPKLSGVGLGLFNLRTIPFIGRARERRLLWSALHEVYRSGRPQAIVLRGPSGMGKSRLARWLCERSHEAGASTVLRARHEPLVGPGSGLPRMFAEHFRCVGLHPWAARPRLTKILGQLGVHDVATIEETVEFLQLAEEAEEAEEARREGFKEFQEQDTPRPGDDAPEAARSGTYDARPADRVRLVTRLLRHLGRPRPVLVFLDDVHHGLDTLSLVRAALTRGRSEPGGDPVLYVLTVTDEELAQRPAEAAELTALCTLDVVRVWELGPLDVREADALISHMLPLEPELHRRLVARAGGNPLFACQLVADWVSRGALQPSPEGFALVTGATIDIPDDLYAVWTDRIARLLHGVAARRVLELAAALGREFAESQLAAVCEQAGIPYDRDLLPEMARARLLTAAGTTWSFVHPMIRESLERSAREAGRWERLNLICARLLDQPGADARRVAERRAAHLLAAGALEDAVEEFLLAAEHRHRSGEPGQAIRLLELREQTLRELGVPEDDLRWGRGWVLAANAALRRGDFESATALAERAVEVSERVGNDHTRAKALDALAFVARRAGDLAGSLRHSQAALALHEELDDPGGRASALLNLGHTKRSAGDSDEATDLFGQARELFATLSDEAGEGRCLLALGHAAADGGDLERARKAYRRARELFTRVGNSFLVLACDSGIARLDADDAARDQRNTTKTRS